LLKKHKQLPEKINIQIKDGYFESRTEVYWNLERIAPNEIIEDIDKIVNRSNWGYDEFRYTWKTYNDCLDNDASMSIDKKTGTIEELSFRADLREEKLRFLVNMIALGKKYDWLFMDRKGVLSNPELEEVKIQIRNSNAHRFLKDPKKYLNDLGSNELKID